MYKSYANAGLRPPLTFFRNNDKKEIDLLIEKDGRLHPIEVKRTASPGKGDMGFVWPIGDYSTWAAVHTFSAYALCALTVVHLAMHWAFLASAFKVEYSPSRRRAISRGVNAMAALGVLALGVAAAGKVAPQEAGATAKQPVAESSSGRNPATKPGASGSATKPGAGGSLSAGDSAEGGSTSGSSSSSSGVCTLCRKRCSLSAPKCDKPYQEGLL